MDLPTPTRTWSLQALADAVNRWCAEHHIEPANGQAATALTDRNIRYYRTLGLLDAPLHGGGDGYGEAHFHQLAALRVLQARGLPLRRIQQLLYGRSLDELRELLERGAAEVADRPRWEFEPGAAWQMVGLDREFALVCRGGRLPTPGQLAAIHDILHPTEPLHSARKATR